MQSTRSIQALAFRDLKRSLQIVITVAKENEVLEQECARWEWMEEEKHNLDGQLAELWQSLLSV